VRVTVAHAWSLLSEGLSALLRLDPVLDVTPSCSDLDVALSRVRECGSSIVLADIELVERGEYALVGALPPDVRLIVLAGGDDRDRVVRALRRGVWGVVLASASADTLVRAVRMAAAGEPWVDRQMVLQFLSMDGPSGERRPPLPRESLTAREMEIITALAEGATNRDVAVQLGIGVQTVKNHVSAIFDKLGVSNRLELALYALHHHLPGRMATATLRPHDPAAGAPIPGPPARLARARASSA